VVSGASLRHASASDACRAPVLLIKAGRLLVGAAPLHLHLPCLQLGADRVIDYRQERFEDACKDAPLDCVIDGAGQ